MNDQRSLLEQLRDTIRLANEAGMYDAADWIGRTLIRQPGGVYSAALIVEANQ